MITQIQGLDAKTLLDKFDLIAKRLSEIETKNKPQPLDKLITRKEVSELLKVSLVTIHHWTKSGVLKAYRIGSKVRFKESEVLQALQSINENE